jgi:hypothetical protein
MAKINFFSICLFWLTCSAAFSQTEEFRKVFIINNTEADIVKGKENNTVNAMLSRFTEEEIENFKKKMSSFSGVQNISVSPIAAPTYKCIITLEKGIKKGAMLKVLESAGVEYVAIDDVKCSIRDYKNILEEKKKKKSNNTSTPSDH